MNYVWNYVLISWLLVKFLVLSVIPAQLEYTWVVDPDRDPSLLYCPDDALITILNISVKNEEYCGSQPCVIDDRDHEALKRLCDNSHFCLIYGSNFSSACLLGQRSFNMSYMCEAPVSLDCNFENDLLCNWEQGKEDEFDWTRNSGWTSTPSTGPFSDHTTKSGFYMYIQSSEKGRNDTAQFISKSIVRKNEQCLTFWYHMRGDDIGSLKVYQKQNISMKCIWTKIGPQGKQWIKAYVDLAKYDNYQIVFEGVIKDSNGRSKGETAIDDVYVSDGKCNGPVEQPGRCSLSKGACIEDEIINRTCLSVDQENTIEECTTFYLRIDSLDVTLYPSFPNSNNGNECINRENENVMILDNVCRVNYLYSNCKFKLSRIFEDDNDCYTFKKKMLITYLCSDMNTTTVSSDSTSKDSSADSSAAVETTTVSSFTTLRRGSSTVSDESVTLSRVMKNSSDSATGLVVGLVIGGLLLACAVIFIVVLFRRHTIKSRPRKKMRNNLGGHDYIGSQDITLQQTANHSSHMQNDGMYDQLESKNTIVHGYESTQINNIQQKYTSVGAANGFVNKEGVQTPTYAVRRDKTFADNHMSNGDEYAIDEPTAETSFNETIDNRTGTADSYIVLDPNDTGFNRTTLSNTPTCYGFVKPVRDTRNKIGDDDQYAISDEGVYDYSGSNRQKELENNIYNHAVDTIYDSGSHKRRNEGREDTYDHFFGQKTEDDYDVSTTT